MKKTSLIRGMLCLIVSGLFYSCAKDTVAPVNTDWKQVASLDEISSFAEAVSTTDHVYMIGNSVGGSGSFNYFISIDANGQVVEKRPLKERYAVLTKDFYATYTTYQKITPPYKDSTIVTFYSTTLHKIDPIATIDAREFIPSTSSNYGNAAVLHFSGTAVKDGSYAVAVIRDNLSQVNGSGIWQTDVGMASFKVNADGITIVNRQVGATFVDNPIEAGINPQIVSAFSNQFLVKTEVGLYSYDPSGSFTKLSNQVTKFPASAQTLVRNDTLFMRKMEDNNNLYYSLDLNNWKNFTIVDVPFVYYYSIGSVFVTSDLFAINVFKTDLTKGTIREVKTDMLKGVKTPNSGSGLLVESGGRVYVAVGNLIYTKDLPTFLSK